MKADNLIIHYYAAKELLLFCCHGISLLFRTCYSSRILLTLAEAAEPLPEMLSPQV